MELAGSGYLYALATLSMTFAGFSAIVIVLRQTLGRQLSPFHLLITRLYIESGFWAAAFSMLPPLLALCDVPTAAVWRISSAAIAAVLIVYGATYRMRRQAVVQDTLPSRRWVAIACVSVAVIAGLVCNVIGIPYRPNPAPVAIAATWTLACGAIVFVLALARFWETDGVSGS
jgi:hypothetical protein